MQFHLTNTATPAPAATTITLTEAKLLADKLSAGKSTLYTVADMHQALKLLEATSRGSKTQKAWDRLDRRLVALRSAIARRA